MQWHCFYRRRDVTVQRHSRQQRAGLLNQQNVIKTQQAHAYSHFYSIITVLILQNSSPPACQLTFRTGTTLKKECNVVIWERRLNEMTTPEVTEPVFLQWQQRTRAHLATSFQHAVEVYVTERDSRCCCCCCVFSSLFTFFCLRPPSGAGRISYKSFDRRFLKSYAVSDSAPQRGYDTRTRARVHTHTHTHPRLLYPLKPFPLYPSTDSSIHKIPPWDF